MLRWPFFPNAQACVSLSPVKAALRAAAIPESSPSQAASSQPACPLPVLLSVNSTVGGGRGSGELFKLPARCVYRCYYNLCNYIMWRSREAM